MPRHQQVTECRRGGPVTSFCSCVHCTLSVCAVCGGGEGALTTDCPGEPISGDRLEEICETMLDYTDDRGWHLGETWAHAPRFATREPAPEATPPSAHAPLLDPPGLLIGCACGWRTPQGATDSDDAFATHAASASLTPSTNWEAVDRTLDLEHELALKAVAWALADRSCEDHAATLARIEDEANVRMPKGQEQSWLTESNRELLGKLEHEQISFRLADQRAQKCDDEFRQAARKLVDALEKGSPTVLTVGANE